MPTSRIVGGAIVATILASGPLAEANGRYPEANHVTFAAGDPELVLVRVTFGLLVSRDRGGTWDWVCEQSVGFNGIEDPLYTVTPSNALVASTFNGIAVTRDGACNWAFAPMTERQLFVDLTSTPANPARIVALSSVIRGSGGEDGGANVYETKLVETVDEARSFAPVFGPLDPSLAGYTVDLAASDPDRIYVTAARNAYTSDPTKTLQMLLLVSRDRGASWTETEIARAGDERAVYIAAVDAANAGRVYVRTSSDSGPSRLLAVDVPSSADAGAPQVRTLFEATGPLAGFALSPDGNKVFAGGPQDGLHVARTNDFVFEQRSKIPVQCLAMNADGLWACSEPRASGFVIGLSKDEGATFESKAGFCSVRGPLACAPGSTTTERCTGRWLGEKTLLGCAPLPDAGAPGATPSPPPPEGCGCRVAASRREPLVVLGLASLATVVLRVRRRRANRR